MYRVSLILVAAGVAIAAWLSQGTIGFTAADGPRLGLLPLTIFALVVSLGAGILAATAVARGAPRVSLLLLLFVALPWLPAKVPATFLVWTGPILLLIWAAALLPLSKGGWHFSAKVPATFSGAGAGVSPAVVAGACAFVIFSIAAWRVAPHVPGGDEPHYLVITQSLLLDGDLEIDNNHQRRDYRAYYAGDLPPHVQRRGRHGEMYSIHAPGLSALVLPAFAVAGYRGVVIFLVLLAATTSALTWKLARDAAATRTDDEARATRAAWFAWAAVTLSATTIFHAFTVYPDGAGMLFVLSGLWALLRAEAESRSGSTRVWPWMLHGVALSVLPWLHSRFAILAGGLGALILLRLSTTKNPAAKAVAFLSVPAVTAILWLGFFIALYGRPDPSAPYAQGEMGSFAFVPGGLGGLLFDQRFGLFTYAPVLLFGFIGLALMLTRREWRRLGGEIVFIVVPYALTVTHFAMWWGGWSAPARFLAPVLPLLCVPLAASWLLLSRAGRAVALAALTLTLFASSILVFVARGRLAYNVRDTPSLWLEWLGRAADLVRAAPSWSRTADLPLFRSIAIWAASFAAAWLVVRLCERRGWLTRPATLSTATAAALAIAAMGAMTMTWRLEGTDGRAVIGAQFTILRQIAAGEPALTLTLDRPGIVRAANVAGRMRIALDRGLSTRRGGRDASIFALPPLPPGEYRITATPESARGWLMIGIGRDQSSISTGPLSTPPQPIDVKLPVAVRSLVVRGDEEAHATVSGVTIEPLSLARDAGNAFAQRAARYGEWTVFFLDDRAFVEPAAFWVGGARSTTFALQPDAEVPAAPLILRNGANENRVQMKAGEWRAEWSLAPGQEVQVEVPIDRHRGSALVTIDSASGFRPSEHDPQNRDDRFLGVYVRFQNLTTPPK